MAGKAVITGATSGIGGEFAQQLAARGHDLLLTGRRREKLEQARAALTERYGVSVELFIGDLAEPAVRRQLSEAVIAALPVDILVNNAGFGLTGHFLDEPAAAHIRMLAVHNELAVTLCHAIGNDMARRGGGTIINVSSLASLFPVPGGASYAATKAFLTIFSESLAVELSPREVKVQALLPGFTYTEFHRYMEDVTEFRKSTGPLPWSSAASVVRYSLKKLSGRSVLCIPGFRNRALYAVSRVLPRRLVYAAARRVEL